MVLKIRLAAARGKPTTLRRVGDLNNRGLLGRREEHVAVSYTHLDVYKRQVYTRQDIWSVRAADYRPPGSAPRQLTRRAPADEWDIQLLYALSLIHI